MKLFVECLVVMGTDVNIDHDPDPVFGEFGVGHNSSVFLFLPTHCNFLTFLNLALLHKSSSRINLLHQDLDGKDG
jgi:hypothetical protein